MENRFGKLATRWALVLGVALAGFGGNASATLLDRAPDMVYDTVLNITWTRQAGDSVNRDWADANAWAADLVFGGFDDWRLPYASVSAGVGPASGFDVVACNVVTEMACRDNEMGYMFYYNLDGNEGDNKTGNQTAVGGEMLTGIGGGYWSGTELSPQRAWVFTFLIGAQDTTPKVSGTVGLFAWAVRPGDVAAAPEPASLLLLGVGVLALGLGRRAGRHR